MLLLVTFLAVLILLLKVVNRWKNRKLIKLSEQLKSDTPCWPLIGHAYKFIGNGEAHMKAFTDHFGREAIRHEGLTSFWMGHMLFVVIADAEDADFILKNYLEKGFVMNFVRDVIGNGNIVAPVPVWRHRRKILVRTLTPKHLEALKNIFAKNSRMLVQRLESKVGTGSFPIWQYFSTYTMDSICELSFGEDLEETQKKEIVEALERGFRLCGDRIARPWQYNSALFKLFPSYYSAEKLKKFCNDYFGKKIATKREELRRIIKIRGNEIEKDTKSFKSFTELLMESSYGDRQYTDREIQEEILVLFIAGSDTTAIGSGFATVMMARHPDVQEKVYEEIKEVFGDSTAVITTEDLRKLKYLDAVIKETLRLYSPVPVIARQSDRELTLPSGVTIPSNCLLLVNIWAMHRNPKYWGSDAEEFRPERWLDHNFTLKHPAQFMPFSYGPRNCAGYKFAMSSMKMLLATMLRRYRVTSDTEMKTNGLHKPLRLKLAITMKNTDNFIVSLEERIEPEEM